MSVASDSDPSNQLREEHTTSTPNPPQGSSLLTSQGPPQRRKHSLPIPHHVESKIDTETWGDVGIDPATATTAQLGTEVAFLMEIWKEDHLRGRALWGRVRRDLQEWGDEDFNKLPKYILALFYDYLYANGVWIEATHDPQPRPRRSRRIAAALEPPYHVWTPEEVDKAAAHIPAFEANLDDKEFRHEITRPTRRFIPPPLAGISSSSSIEMARTTSTAPAEIAPSSSRAIGHNQNAQHQGPAAFTPSASYIPPEGRQPFVPLAQGQPWQHPSPTRSSPARQDPASAPLLLPIEPDMPTPKMNADLAKMYDDSMKYGGELYDILSAKLAIFKDACRRAGITSTQYAGAFPTMLKGRARDYYYQHICPHGPLPLDAMILKMRAKFETQETHHAYLAQWRETTLAKVRADNPSKTTTQCLETLIERLDQLALALGYSSEEPAGGLRMHLLNACQGHPACKLALYSPASTYEGVLAQLRAAISTDEAAESFKTDINWTDRTYNGNGRQARYGGHRRAAGAISQRPGLPQSPKICYVCGKTGCWSTKHPAAERDRSFAAYRSRFNPVDNSRKAYAQFLAWHEGPAPAQPESTPYDEALEAYFQALGDGGIRALPPSSGDDDGDDDDTASGTDEEAPKGYFSAAYFNTPFNGHEAIAALGDNAVAHALTKATPGDDPSAATNAPGPPSTFALEGRYAAHTFQGIMPDTGAAKISTAGHSQFAALQRSHPVTLDTTTAGQAEVRFGPGQPVASLGTTTVPTPLGDLVFHVVPTPTPFLLCLQDMDSRGIMFDNLSNVLRKGSLAVPVVRKWGHPWMLLQPEKALGYSHLTEGELRRLHRRFGHPSVHRLRRLLTRAGHETDIKALEAIERICKPCQLHAGRPGRFKFTLHDDHHFNYEIIVDIFYLEGNRPVLHVVDEATSFNAARFLQDISATTTWATLRLCWIDVYQGPPDWIVTDAGKQFHAAEFRQAARALAISIKEVPIEAHHSIGKVERYHAPIRRAYEILREEDPTASRETSLQMAVKAVNDTAGPNGLVPTLLVFGAYPRITDASPPSPDITRRAAAITKAMSELRKMQAARQVTEALAARNGPTTSATAQLPLLSQVRVWREKKGWQGPYQLLAVDGETLTIALPHGPARFRSTVVKPFYTDDTAAPTETPQEHPPPSPVEPATFEPTIPLPTKRGPGRPRKVPLATPAPLSPIVKRRSERPHKNTITVAYLYETDAPEPTVWHAIFISSKEASDLALALELRKQRKITTTGLPFEASTAREIDALIERGVFEFTLYSPEAHGDARIFKSRIVNEVKSKATDAPYEKSRLVIQGFADGGKEAILTQAPTIQRASQRLILALAPSLISTGFILWIRDITQAYVQSATPLNRAIYAALPKEIAHLHPAGTIMRVIKPLYGIAEAGTHWWATYHRHHRDLLGMETSTYDPCLLVTTASSSSFGCVGMQTDDTLGLSDLEFSERENKALADAAFTAKPKTILSPHTPLMFNGGIVTLADNGNLTLRQKGQGRCLSLVDLEAPPAEAKQQYVEQRARAAYLASICQPEACFDLSSAAQQQDPSPEEIKKLNHRLEWQIANLDRGLVYLPLDLATAALYVFVDGSFANNNDMSSQLGFVIILANETASQSPALAPVGAATPRGDAFSIRGNIVHYSSTKCKRVTRSVLASEVYGMVAGVDIAYTLATTLEKITARLGLPPIPTIVCTDSYSLYECLVKLGTTKEKRLMIDIMALRQSYERRELHEVRWINGEDNPADALTKATPNRALERFIDSSALEVRMEGWVTRA